MKPFILFKKPKIFFYSKNSASKSYTSERLQEHKKKSNGDQRASWEYPPYNNRLSVNPADTKKELAYGIGKGKGKAGEIAHLCNFLHQ